MTDIEEKRGAGENVDAERNEVAELIPEKEWDQALPNKLRDKNYIDVFDAHLDFDQKQHVYFLDGKKLQGSSTGFIHSFFEHFDADAVIQKMRANKQKWNPKNKYFYMTDDQIKALWSGGGSEAAQMGTRMHLLIEWFYNDLVTERQLVALKREDIDQFLEFHREVVLKKEWEPFRTELRAYSEKHLLAGSVDMIFKQKKDGRLIIVDWKRSKEIKEWSVYKKRGKPPLEHMDDCNYNHYSLQLNLYQWFLEHKTEHKIAALYLAIFHPNQTKYNLIAVPPLQHEIEQMLLCREISVNQVLLAAEKDKAMEVEG